jgi:FAD/FMN-containing dehydrogenase
VALLAVPDLAGAVRLSRQVQSGPAVLLGAEVVDAPGVSLAAQALGQPDPLPGGAPWLLLLEVADGGTGGGFGPVADQVVAVATDAAGRKRLWALRERQTELYATLPGLQKLDVSVRLADLDAVVAAIRAVATRADPDPGGGTIDAHSSAEPPAAGVEGRPWVGVFGPALAGNLHVQLGAADGETADRVLRAVAELGGSISAEHGIGRLKVDQLHLARSAEQIDWMRRIKATVDPDGRLNPGVLVDPAPR